MYVIKEAKQVGTLFHITDYEGLKYLLENNSLKSKNYKFISFTRNKRYSYVVGSEKKSICRIYIDGNKLSDRYKIVPFVDKGPYVSGNRFEAEEIVFGEIKNIIKYIIYIEIFDKFKNKIDNSTKFLLKKYKIKTNIELFSDLNDNISGFYKNGKLIYKIDEKNIYDIYFKYIDMRKYDSMDKGWLLSQSIPAFINEIYLNSFDIIFIYEKERIVFSRVKNEKLYKSIFNELKDFKLEKINYN